MFVVVLVIVLVFVLAVVVVVVVVVVNVLAVACLTLVFLFWLFWFCCCWFVFCLALDTQKRHCPCNFRGFPFFSPKTPFFKILLFVIPFVSPSSSFSSDFSSSPSSSSLPFPSYLLYFPCSLPIPFQTFWSCSIFLSSFVFLLFVLFSSGPSFLLLLLENQRSYELRHKAFIVLY